MSISTSNTSFGAFQVERKDKDGKIVRVYWRRYRDKAHRNAAKSLRRAGIKEVPTKDPWAGKRRRFYRLKPNNHCPCEATWPENDTVEVRAGKRKKFKHCCKK